MLSKYIALGLATTSMKIFVLQSIGDDLDSHMKMTWIAWSPAGLDGLLSFPRRQHVPYYQRSGDTTAFSTLEMRCQIRAQEFASPPLALPLHRIWKHRSSSYDLKSLNYGLNPN